MKKFFIFVLFSLQALALTESVQGSGYTSGYCRGDGFSTLCMNQLKDRANSDAARDADIQCRARQGQLLVYTASCFTNCNPPYIPNNQDTYVSCNARCRFDCDIRRP